MNSDWISTDQAASILHVPAWRIRTWAYFNQMGFPPPKQFKRYQKLYWNKQALLRWRFKMVQLNAYTRRRRLYVVTH